MGCGCGRKTSATGMRVTGLRGVGTNPNHTPRQGRIVTPRTMPPTMVRQAQMKAMQEAQTPPNYSLQRREVERKRRLAILKAQGK